MLFPCLKFGSIFYSNQDLNSLTMAYKALHDQARPRSQSNVDTVCAKPMLCVLSEGI